jgi:hypothetical protein
MTVMLFKMGRIGNRLPIHLGQRSGRGPDKLNGLYRSIDRERFRPPRSNQYATRGYDHNGPANLVLDRL